jgi:hypothetical protein
MRKILFLTAAAMLILTASYGQQPDNDVESIARRLATQIPEIDGELIRSWDICEHYFQCNAKGAEHENVKLQFYRYERPTETSDLVLVTYDPDFPIEVWLKCFACDRKTGMFTEVELPFKILPASAFDKAEFDEEQVYWHTNYTIFENGNVVIDASASMSYHCIMLAVWDSKGDFKLHKVAGFDAMKMETGEDNDEMEQYVRKVIRPNFERINAIKKWASIVKNESMNLDVTYYFSAGGLEKIVAGRWGGGEGLGEYYFLDGRLSFIYDITVLPDAKTERRWYLKGDTCFRGIGNNGKKLTPAQIEEEFLGNNDEGGAFSQYQSILGF